MIITLLMYVHIVMHLLVTFIYTLIYLTKMK